MVGTVINFYDVICINSGCGVLRVAGFSLENCPILAKCPHNVSKKCTIMTYCDEMSHIDVAQNV